MTEQDSKAPGTSWGDVPRWVWLGVAACVAFAVIAVAMTRGDDTSDGGSRGAKDACQQFVKDRLKSPGTAKFSGETATGGGPWTVTGQVDSQNAFGGTVRNTYNCRITSDDNDRWTLDALDMSSN